VPLSAHNSNANSESSGPAVAEPLASSAMLAAATPMFLGSPTTFSVAQPGIAFSLELDLVAVASSLVAITLGGLALALLRGARGRARLFVAASVACVAGIVELGFGVGLF
jgi:hypothetical protein